MTEAETPSSDERIEHLRGCIAALDAQRALLGDAAVDTGIEALKRGLDALRAGLRPGTPALPEQALKQVTVLFTDIVGSTSLAQRLDPEEIHAVLDTALAAMTACIDAEGGRVLQYTGDGMLAAFGSEGAREDDAERAVRAGLALIKAAEPFRERVRERHRHEGFGVRVGLATGPVLLGGGVDAGNSIRGMTVNIAARMEQNAQPGTMRIEHATWRLVRGRFALAPQPPLAVKGRDEPVLTYLVEGELPPGRRSRPRGIEGLETPLVGRGPALAALRALATAAEPVQALTLLAEPGLGKSRLLDAWRAEAAGPHAPPALWLGAAAQPASRGQPYGLLRELLAPHLGLAEAADAPAARDALCRAVEPLLAGESHELAAAQAHVLGQLLGLDFSASPHVSGILRDGLQLKNRAFAAVLRLLDRLGENPAAPLIIVVDDLHWADDGTLALLEHLLARGLARPLRVVALARPELAERRPAWARGAGVHRAITLENLAAADVDALADALLSRIDTPPEALRRLLVERAQGNPFFMEELLRMLIDEGAIEAGPDRWQVLPGRLQAARVPVTLAGVLQARIDRLMPRERLALQQAAVIGNRFWERALQALDTHALPALERLQQRGLVQPADEAEDSLGPAWRFAHQLQHQVAYETVLKRLRTGCHRQTAEWLAAQPAAQAHLAEIGEHFERGEELARAVDYRTRAAEDAVLRYAHDTVIEQVTRALALPTAGPALRWRLLLARQRSRRVQGDIAGQEDDLAALEALAAAQGDAGWRATVALRRAVATQLAGELQAAEPLARAALVAAEAAGDEVSAVSALSVQAAVLRALGRHAEARQVAEPAVARARAAAQPVVEAELLTVLAAIANDQGDPQRSETLLRQSLPIDRATGNRLGEAAALINLGDTAYRQGRHTEAQDWLDQALRVTRALGLRQLEAAALLNLAGVHHQRGDDTTARAHAEAACALADALANAEWGAFARLALGHAQLALGEARAAGAAFGQAAGLLQTAGLAHLVVEAEAGLAEVALQEGDTARALVHAEPVLAQHTRDGHLDGTEHPLQLRWVCWRALHAAGDARAAQVLTALRADLEAAAPAEPGARAEWLASVPYRAAIAAAR